MPTTPSACLPTPPAAPPTPAETDAPTLSDADALAAATDDALFDRLRHVIETERLYLDPTFDRQALISRYGLTKERIGAAFAKGSDHPSLSAYVAQLRLEYAYQLLIAQPDLSLEEVAIRSGFSSRKFFSDRFKSHFGMSPTEFRLAHQ